MQGQGHSILGISPGGQRIGIAIFKDKELIDWRIKRLDGLCSSTKLQKVISLIERCIKDHDITHLALKLNHKTRNSHYLEEMAKKIIVLAKEKQVKVYNYTIEELKKYFSEIEIINTAELFEKIADKLPELYYEYKSDLEKDRGYYLKMFEAVAVGLISQEEIKLSPKRPL